jgi:hypothetical protein
MDTQQPLNPEKPHPLAGKTIPIDESDFCEPEPSQFGPRESEQGLALMLARKLYETDDYMQDDVINIGTGIGVSPEFCELVDQAVQGKLPLRYFATIFFLAGRVSIALGQQR